MGKLTVKVTIRQGEVESGPPRVEVDGFLGTLHLLLSPQQLHLLLEIAESLEAAQGNILQVIWLEITVLSPFQLILEQGMSSPI